RSAGAQKVRITVAREAARAAAEAKEGRVGLAQISVRNLKGANVGLVVAEALVLGGVLRTQFDGHTGRVGDIDHGLIDALGVHVDFDGSTGAGDRFEERLPKRIAALGDSALAV